MAGDAERGYWAAVTARIGERCVFYSDEDLAAFAEGRIRGRNRRALEAHLQDCEDCRSIVQELRRELAPEPAAVRVRFAPARGWIWALAAGTAATALIVAVALRLGGPGVVPPASSVGPRPPVNVAEAPPPGVGVRAGPATSSVTPRATDEAPSARGQPAPGRRHLPPPSGVQPTGQTAPPSEAIVNVLPSTAVLAFAEPPGIRPVTAAEVEGLLRQDAVNDLPEQGAEPPDQALADEFYQGFDKLVEDLRTKGEEAQP